MGSTFTTLIVLVMIMGIFDVVIHHAEDLDYSTMEYLGSIENRMKFSMQKS